MSPELALDQLHSLEHGSVKDENENSLLKSEVRFRNNDGMLFGYPMEETSGTTFASSIKTYVSTCNGHVAWMALNTQHAGEIKGR